MGGGKKGVQVKEKDKSFYVRGKGFAQGRDFQHQGFVRLVLHSCRHIEDGCDVMSRSTVAPSPMAISLDSD